MPVPSGALGTALMLAGKDCTIATPSDRRIDGGGTLVGGGPRSAFLTARLGVRVGYELAVD